MPDRLDADTVFLNIAGGQPLSEDPLGLAAFAPPRPPGATADRFPTLPSRPLGLSNALDAHYFHAAVNESEYFALSGGAHSGWNENALAGLGGLAAPPPPGGRPEGAPAAGTARPA